MKHSSGLSLVQVQPNPAAIPAPLRYYDPELQNAWNVEPFDNERLMRAQTKGMKLHAAYLRQVATLAPRLSKQTFSHVAAIRSPLFDADLVAFSFGDLLGHAAPRKRRKRLETTVQATFRSFEEDKLHLLAYRNIAALNVNVPADRWFDAGGNKRIDSLLADELTNVDATLMQHAFLFASGAAISIQFEHVSWKTKRISC